MTQWQPEQYDPRHGQQRPATPPQWQQDAPQRDYRPPQPQFQPQPAYQPQGYGPQYQPPQYAPQPPQRPRKSRKGLAFLGCGGLGALVVLIAVLASSSTPSSPSPAARPQAPAPAAVKAKTVATFSGNGVQSTPPFTVTSTWRLDYKFDCSNFGAQGNFLVMEDGGLAGAMDVNALAMSKSGTSYAYNDAGQHYIKVDSECSWSLKVIDEG